MHNCARKSLERKGSLTDEPRVGNVVTEQPLTVPDASLTITNSIASTQRKGLIYG